MLLRDQGIDCTEVDKGECEVDIGRNLNAYLVLSGELVQLDKEWICTLKIHSTDKAALVASDKARAESPSRLLDGPVKALAQRLTAQALQSSGGGGILVPEITAKGEVQIQTGQGVDYKTLALQAARAKQIREQRELELKAQEAKIRAQERRAREALAAERRRLADQERRASEALAQEQKRRFEQARDALLAKAHADLEAIRPLLRMDLTPETRPVLMKYLEQYEEAAVTVDGKRRAVDIPGVQEVLTTMKRPSAAERKRLGEARRRERERLMAFERAAAKRAARRRKKKRLESARTSSMIWATYIAPLAATGTGLLALSAETDLAEDVAGGKIPKSEWERRRGHINRTYVATYVFIGSIIPTGLAAAMLAPYKPEEKPSGRTGGSRSRGFRFEVSGAW